MGQQGIGAIILNPNTGDSGPVEELQARLITVARGEFLEQNTELLTGMSGSARILLREHEKQMAAHEQSQEETAV